MTAFATYADLGTRLNRTFTGDEQAWVTALLEDAADFMRGVMRGNQVYPSQQSTYTAYPIAGRVTLPQMFVRSVDSVQSNATDVEYVYRAGIIYLTCDNPVDVTFTFGLDTAPGDLVNINCALTAQQMMTVAAGLGLTAGGVSSVAIDDFKAAFADGGASTGMSLTPTTQQYLERRYSKQVWVVSSR